MRLALALAALLVAAVPALAEEKKSKGTRFWNLTGETIATELYDEKNDPKETVSVASKPENENATILATLTKALDAAYDGIGSGAVPKKKHAEPKKPATDRDALFTKRDKDGVLSREEFVKQGKLK